VPRRGTHWRLRVPQAEPGHTNPNPTQTEQKDNPDD
jgi:hypothetical protein